MTPKVVSRPASSSSLALAGTEGTTMSSTESSTTSCSQSIPASSNKQQTKTIRWGIISAGRISSDFTKAIQATGASMTTSTTGSSTASSSSSSSSSTIIMVSHQVVAVAARDLSRAQEFASQHENIPHVFGDYTEMIQSASASASASSRIIDVIYIGSVADQHYELAKECLEAGVSIVVEKPLTLSYAQTKELVDLAQSKTTTPPCFFMEGMWTRCFPATLKVRELVAAGRIGRPVMVQGDFGWSTANCGPKERIWFPESGGMLLDIGMYLAQWGQVAFGNDARVTGLQSMGTTLNGVDHTSTVQCRYRFAYNDSNDNTTDNDTEEHTGFLQFYVTGESNTEERMVIQGTKGRIFVEPPHHVPHTIRVELDQGRTTSAATSSSSSSSSSDADDGSEVYHFPLPDDTYTSWNYPGSIGFTHQIQAVGEALAQGWRECPHYTWQNSLQVAAILDTIRNQIKEQQSEQEGKGSITC